MHAVLLRITFPDTQTLLARGGNVLDIACSCISFTHNETCEHYKATYGNERNRIRILDYPAKGIEPGEISEAHTWEGVRYPGFAKDTVKMWHVYNRGKLLSFFQTSAAVLLDIRASRLKRRLKERLQCTVCPFVARNRMLCIHETAGLGLMS